MGGSYDYWLVLLSVIVAIVASYVALDLGSRVHAEHHSRRGRWLWLAGGACSMGTGIWSMHFIGMLAFRWPISVSYDIPITLLSGVAAISASGFALFVVSRERLRPLRLLGAGVLMGIGIVAMHYIGMAAMPMEPPIRYQPLLVALSVATAIAASIMALWSAFRLRMETILTAFWKKAGSALVMGSGIYGMHYSARAAAQLAPNAVCGVTPWSIDPTGLAGALGAFTLLFLVGTLLISAYDAFRAATASRRVDELSRRLVRIQDDERRALAAELHDIVGQNLSSVNAELALLRGRLPPEHAAGVSSAAALVKKSVEAVRHVMIELWPPGLDELGLPAALKWHAERAAAQSAIEVTVEADESLQRPSPKVEDAMLRIYLEALNNVAKHAGARKVHVLLQPRGDEVVLTIADDGRGFEKKRRASHDGGAGWGLVIMEERARSVGAELRVRPTPGGGTTLELAVPREKWS
jgi:NO-binding membrane sensor protein with MHYT domain/two-component sensor histidine kinase